MDAIDSIPQPMLVETAAMTLRHSLGDEGVEAVVKAGEDTFLARALGLHFGGRLYSRDDLRGIFARLKAAYMKRRAPKVARG